MLYCETGTLLRIKGDAIKFMPGQKQHKLGLCQAKQAGSSWAYLGSQKWLVVLSDSRTGIALSWAFGTFVLLYPAASWSL